MAEDDDEESSDDSDADIPQAAIDFAKDAVQIGGDDGEMSFDKLDEYLNETRDYDVDAEATAEANDDLEVDEDTVSIT